MFIGIKTGWAPGEKMLSFVPALHYFFILYSTRCTQLIPY